jgi:hypothetical protein
MDHEGSRYPYKHEIQENQTGVKIYAPWVGQRAAFD